MPSVTTKTLRMTFATSMGNSVSYSLKNPVTGLTAAAIEAVMDTIIAKDIFLTASGGLVAKKDIRIVDMTTNDLYDVLIV